MEISPVYVHVHNEPIEMPLDEVLRYMGCNSVAPSEIFALATRAIDILQRHIRPKACYRIIDNPGAEDNVLDFGCMQIESEGLLAHLANSAQVCVFAATVGIEVDRLILRYSQSEPSLALALQSAGAAAIESYCDILCRDVLHTNAQRYSAGYGDLPLTAQKSIFSFLDCTRSIGLTLTDGCMMMPSKSVTAFVAIQKHCATEKSKCATCTKTDCEFRRGK